MDTKFSDLLIFNLPPLSTPKTKTNKPPTPQNTINNNSKISQSSQRSPEARPPEPSFSKPSDSTDTPKENIPPRNKFKPHTFAVQNLVWALRNCPSARHRFCGPPSSSPPLPSNLSPSHPLTSHPSSSPTTPYLHLLPTSSEVLSIRRSIHHESELAKISLMSKSARKEYLFERRRAREGRGREREEREERREAWETGLRGGGEGVREVGLEGLFRGVYLRGLGLRGRSGRRGYGAGVGLGFGYPRILEKMEFEGG